MLTRRATPAHAELMEHVNRIGVTLRSAGLMRHRVASANSLISARTFTPHSLPASFGRYSSAATYINDVVVKIGSEKDKKATTSSSECRLRSSRPQSQLTELLQGATGSATRTPRAPPASASVSELRSSMTSERLRADRSTTSSSVKPWNMSDQALRYEAEKASKMQNRTRKRTSEISSHRVDRMYYMSGSAVRLEQKYAVDPLEFVRLQQMAHNRTPRSLNNNKHIHQTQRPLPGDVYYANVDEDQMPTQAISNSETVTPRAPDCTQTEDASKEQLTKVTDTARSEVDSLADLDSANEVKRSAEQDSTAADADAAATDAAAADGQLEVVGESKNMSARTPKEDENGDDELTPATTLQ